MKEPSIDAGTIQHDLRREFHNMLGILKIIKNEQVIKDEELEAMMNVCLQRETEVTEKFEELSRLLETRND